MGQLNAQKMGNPLCQHELWPNVGGKSRLMYLSQVLTQEPVALIACDNDCFEIRYSFHLLGMLHERTSTITPARHWHQR